MTQLDQLRAAIDDAERTARQVPTVEQAASRPSQAQGYLDINVVADRPTATVLLLSFGMPQQQIDSLSDDELASLCTVSMHLEFADLAVDFVRMVLQYALGVAQAERDLALSRLKQLAADVTT